MIPLLSHSFELPAGMVEENYQERNDKDILWAEEVFAPGKKLWLIQAPIGVSELKLLNNLVTDFCTSH